MIVKEVGDTFTCDCGFSWLRGNSGAHDCSYGYRKQIAELREKLANIVPSRTRSEDNHDAGCPANELLPCRCSFYSRPRKVKGE